jgi:hypothetical protein
MPTPVPSPVPNPKDPVWSKAIASQTFNLPDIFGTVNAFGISDIDDYFHAVGRSITVFGADIGMCVTAAIFLILLTKPDQRHTPIFALIFFSFHFICSIILACRYNL